MWEQEGINETTLLLLMELTRLFFQVEEEGFKLAIKDRKGSRVSVCK
jgi:hypothetical protein